MFTDEICFPGNELGKSLVMVFAKEKTKPARGDITQGRKTPVFLYGIIWVHFSISVFFLCFMNRGLIVACFQSYNFLYFNKYQKNS